MSWLVAALSAGVGFVGCGSGTSAEPSSEASPSLGGSAGQEESAGGDSGATSCSPFSRCDGELAGTWRFVSECPETYIVLSDTAPESCYRAEVRDEFEGTLTIDSDGRVVLDAVLIETISTIWTAECGDLTGVEQTAEHCAERERRSKERLASTSCHFDGADCTCTSRSEGPVTNTATLVAESLCAQGDELRYIESIPRTAPGNAPAPNRTLVHELTRAR
jgi:hypothetical protein